MFEDKYTGLLFREVAYVKYDVAWFVEHMNFHLSTTYIKQAT